MMDEIVSKAIRYFGKPPAYKAVFNSNGRTVKWWGEFIKGREALLWQVEPGFKDSKYFRCYVLILGPYSLGFGALDYIAEVSEECRFFKWASDSPEIPAFLREHFETISPFKRELLDEDECI